jgi:hypothetical protein
VDEDAILNVLTEILLDNEDVLVDDDEGNGKIDKMRGCELLNDL